MEEMSGEQPQPDASFHDIGKIVNWEAVGLRERRPDGTLEKDPHEFEKCVDDNWQSPEWGIDPLAAPWQSILTRHKQWPQRWPRSMHRWHVKVADWLAAGYARPLSNDERQTLERKPEYTVRRLWVGNAGRDLRLSNSDELHELICFLNTSPTWQEAAEKYGSILACRPEEARPGFNITSLLAHCDITGKLAHVLSLSPPEAWKGVDPAGTPTQKSIRALAAPPRLIVSHIRLGFRQRPYRARDLGVFGVMEKRLCDVVKVFGHHILSSFGTNLLAVFESEESKSAFLRKLEEDGFTIEAQTVDKTILEYLPTSSEEDGQAIRGLVQVLDATRQPVHVQELSPRIDLPICEGCQMARANKHWPKDHLARMEGWTETTRRILEHTAWREIDLAEIPEPDREKLATWLEERSEEDLCEQCFNIRRNTNPVTLLRDWHGDVLYLRIDLDLERLAGRGRTYRDNQTASCLDFLYKNYFRELYPSVERSLLDKLWVPLPTVVDFVNDYKVFLNTVRAELENAFARRTAILSEELCCLGLENRNELFDVIETVSGAFSKAFPKLLELPIEVDNPISIALSLSKKKHPFFDHWRFLEQPPHDVAVLVIGSGEARFRLADYEKIKKALKGAKPSQLHKLATAAGISESLGKLVLYEQDNRGIVLSEFSKLVPDVLEFESARVLANLMEG